MLRRHIVAEPCEALRPGVRRRDHDRSAVSAPDQVWHSGFAGVEHAGDVHVDDVRPVADADVWTSSPNGKMPAFAATMSSRPNSSTAAVSPASGRRSRERRPVGHDSTPLLLDQSHGLGEILVRGRCVEVRRASHVAADVDGDDVGALLRESNRVTAALPASGARDECNLAATDLSCPAPILVLSWSLRDLSSPIRDHSVPGNLGVDDSGGLAQRGTHGFEAATEMVRGDVLRARLRVAEGLHEHVLGRVVDAA